LIKPKGNIYGRTKKQHYGTLVGLGSFSIGIIVALFLNLEKTNHERNDFVRLFSDDVMKLDKQMDLDLNSYYFSGVDNDFIYLGNVTAPLRLTLVSTDLSQKEEIILTMDFMDYPFRSLKTVVVPPYFYLYDGTVPCLYKGNIGEWVARKQSEPISTFSELVPMDIDLFTIRSILNEKQVFTLGVLDYRNDSIVQRIFEKGLPGQGNNIFDTDGTLTYNSTLNQTVYTFYYRNQFVLYSGQLDSLIFGNTIDTISQARIEIAELKDGTITTSKPPEIVNQRTATFKQYLLVRSKILGRLEPVEIWNKSVIVDVYDLQSLSYKFSFHINNIDKNFMRDFVFNNNRMYSLAGQFLGSYDIKGQQFKWPP